MADLERERLRALVTGDLRRADDLHGREFRLVTPGGDSLSKEEYLGGIAAGAIKYLRWEPEEIEARVRAHAGRWQVVFSQATATS